jgi:membrane protease YdiL (CAAX protease family)
MFLSGGKLTGVVFRRAASRLGPCRPVSAFAPSLRLDEDWPANAADPSGHCLISSTAVGFYLTKMDRRAENSTTSTGAAASPTAAVILFLVSLALHRGLDLLRDTVAPGGVGFKLWAIGTLVVAILLPLYLALRFLRLDARQALCFAQPMWRRTIVVVPVGFAIALGFNMVWPRLIVPSPEFLVEMRKFITYDGAAEFFLVVLGAVVVPSVADELLFRGVMLRAFSVRYGGVAAVLVTAAATAVFHTWELSSWSTLLSWA